MLNQAQDALEREDGDANMYDNAESPYGSRKLLRELLIGLRMLEIECKSAQSSHHTRYRELVVLPE